MLTVIARRVLLAVPVLLLMTAITFVLISFVPGDAARAVLGTTATPEQVAALREQLQLDKPLSVQYFTWLGGAVRGDLGSSLLNGQSVTDLLMARLPVTLNLVVATTIIAAIVGVSLGFLSAIRGGWLGRLVEIASFIGYALPSFWVALGLIILLAVKNPIFPANGYIAFSDDPFGWFMSLVLPVTALTIGGVTGIATQTRDSVLDVLRRDFVRVQFANGYSRGSIAVRHVLRNAAPAIVTVIGLVFVGLLSGAVLVESVFALPGLGQVVVSSTANHDLPVLQGAVLLVTVIVLLVNLLIDLVYRWVDPKVRTS